MGNLRSPRTSIPAALAALMLTAAAGAQAAPQHHHGARAARHRKHHTHVSVIVGPAGPQGPRGPQGATGSPGPAGPQGPGAALFTYDSTAPAATEQNTPLGVAGPLHLTASCVQLGSSLVEVVLGASHTSIVQYDEALTVQDEGATPTSDLWRITDPVTPLPQGLLGLAATGVGTKESYLQSTITLTQPAHGQLSVFEYVSQATNTCHLTAMWTPAS
jgi:hypothetical protein